MKYIQYVIWLGFITIILVGCGDHTTEPKTITIGILNYSPVLAPSIEGFKVGMNELGYIDGETVTYLYEGPINNSEKLTTIAQGYVDNQVDLLLTMTTPATLIAKKVTANTKIPVLFAPTSDPVGTGIVESMTNPGGNITGVTFGVQEARRLEWLLKLTPAVKRLYIPYNPNDQSPITAIKKLETVADKLELALILEETPDDEAVLAAIEAIPNDIDAIWIPPDSLISAHIKPLSAKAIERGLPLSALQHDAVEDGALMSYGFDMYSVGKQASRLADQILKEVKPADLPIETAEFFLTINLRTATAIELDISERILQQAKTVIRE